MFPSKPCPNRARSMTPLPSCPSSSRKSVRPSPKQHNPIVRTHNTRGHWFNRSLLPLAAVVFGVASLSLHSAEAPQAESKAQPAARGKKKAEGPVNFVPATADPLMGDWQGEGGYVAQVLPTAGGKYRANLLTAFDTESEPVAVLEGVRSGDGVTRS